MIESLQQPRAAAADQPAVQAVAERVDVEERERQQKAIALGDLPAGNEVQRIRGEVVMREHGALRRAGGAGGVDDRGGRVAVEVDERPRIVIRGQRREVCLGDRRARLRVDGDVGDLALAIEDVDRHEDHAELHAGQEDVDQLDAVRQIDAQPVALGESARAQRVRHAIAAPLDLAEGERLPSPLQRDVVAAVHE